MTSLASGILWMLFDADEPAMRIIRVPKFVANPERSPHHWRTR